MIANVDDLGRQAKCGGQAAAVTASPPPEAVADVPAASATPRPHHAASADKPALAFVAELAALDTWLPGLEKLHKNVAMSLGARPVERGKLAIQRTTARTTRTGVGWKQGEECTWAQALRVGFEQQVERTPWKRDQ